MTTAKLNSFDADERQSTLAELLQEQGSSLPDAGPNFNMHCHSFFSYNADGWSPSRIAWEARRAGWHAAGLCDFDVLDGVAEFLDAGLRLGLRATANLETRVFFPEYRDVDLTSPGEQGVTYIMGAGFTGVPAPGTAAAATLTEMAQGAGDRNRAVIGRINAELPQVAIDYEQDVVTTTPGGTPRARHSTTPPTVSPSSFTCRVSSIIFCAASRSGQRIGVFSMSARICSTVSADAFDGMPCTSVT